MDLKSCTKCGKLKSRNEIKLYYNKNVCDECIKNNKKKPINLEDIKERNRKVLASLRAI